MCYNKILVPEVSEDPVILAPFGQHTPKGMILMSLAFTKDVQNLRLFGPLYEITSKFSWDVWPLCYLKECYFQIRLSAKGDFLTMKLPLQELLLRI